MTLTQLSVNLVPRSVAALDAAVATTGDTPTDTVNRALQIYAAVVDALAAGHAIDLRDTSTAKSARVERITMRGTRADDDEVVESTTKRGS